MILPKGKKGEVGAYRVHLVRLHHTLVTLQEEEALSSGGK